MANANRQFAGKRSKIFGEAFERRISAACQYYLDLNIAYIEKTPEPFHMTEALPDGKVKGFYVKRGQPDYKGILCDGSAIMFEAKHTDSGQMRQSAITDEQWKNLDIYERFGAQCFVMVSMGLESFYRVPWNIWKQMKELFGRKYMTTADLAPYKLREEFCTILILEGVEVEDED